MIESGVSPTMSGFLGNSGQTHHPLPQDYRLLTTDPSQLSNDLPGDLQSLSWLTSVDVHRLQRMATARLEYSSTPSVGLLETNQVASENTTLHDVVQLQTNAQSSLLGVHILSDYTGNIPSSMAGQVPHEFQPSLQQVFTLAPVAEECPPPGPYGSTLLTNHDVFNQSQLASRSNQELPPHSFPKPGYSYSCLIAMALKNSKTGSLPVSEIYSFMKEHFPYFKTAPEGWKNSVRHNLSLNKCFEKVENKLSRSSRKGCLWALNPERIDRMEEEMQKWKRKDPLGIRRSMAHPDELDKLIMDRPENCRPKPCDPGLGLARPALPLTPQMHHLPVLHLHHHQLQASLDTKTRSPSPAHMSPIHAVPALSQQGKPAGIMYTLQAEPSPEVDILDPSIMDFSLQENLWEEMKDDSFNLDTIDTFSNSPLRLSDCDFPGQGAPPMISTPNLALSDLQGSSLYTSASTYATLDLTASTSQYTGSNHPIALI